MPEPGRVAVVVATYRPPPATAALLGALAEWPGPVIAVDDGSPQFVPPPAGVRSVRLAHNGGVAAALNAGLAAARAGGATHVVTIDQDSHCDARFLTAVTQAWDRAVALGLRPGVVAPQDPGDVRYRGEQVGPFLRTTEVLQSGAMFALDQLDGFREDLVIDGVDTEACLRLSDSGYDVLCLPLPFEHQIGAARPLRIASRRVLVTHHSADRHYFIVRNRLWLAREYGRARPGWALATLRKAGVAGLLAVTLEDDRGRKARAIARGIRDGLRRPL